MSDFDPIKKELRQARSESSDARQTLARARERERSLNERLTEAKRNANPHNQQSAEEISSLERQLKNAHTVTERAREQFNNISTQLSDVWERFLPLTDPIQNIGQFNDSIPILMLPLRLETRFKTVTSRTGGILNQLWVRVFPDECLVDTFEKDLTATERKNARRYWAFHWAAAGDETKERAAWKELVAAHGSGRSGWIRKSYQPSNDAEKPPVPNPAGNFHLIIPAQANEPLGADATAVADFWKKVFLKTEDSQNASELAKKYAPANLKETAAAGANVLVTFVRFPAFDEGNSKPFPWSEAPKVQLLPERFVFLGYHGGKIKTELSNLVRTPLIVGPNPTAEKADQFQENADGDLVTPEEMRWMTDFTEAVNKGMGFRIDLDADTAKNGFERVLVLGVRLGSSETEGKGELEDLLQKHLYGRSGFSIIPQGTPTNNTEENNSGYSRADDPEESFPIFVQGKEQFEYKSDPLQKKDGQWLAEWLGIGLDILKQTPNADQTDQIEARAMNTALWPATFGYWMQKLMNPVFKDSPKTVEMTRWFFNHYVSGRGQIPAVRVGRQPYGIIPASAFSRVNWLRAVIDTPRIAAGSGIANYLLQLHQLLMNLNQTWKTQAGISPHVALPTQDPQQNLLDIIALHPASVEYHARLSHSKKHLWNYYLFSGLSFQYWQNLNIEAALITGAKLLLSAWGYKGTEQPKIFDKYYRTGQERLNGPIVDDLPPSESQLIRAYSDNNKSYINWLYEALGDYEGMLLPQAGLRERPQALLYLLLRHALLEEYDGAGHKARFNAKVITESVFREALVTEPEFIHINTNVARSESRIAHLLEPEPSIFNNQNSVVKNIGIDVKKVTPAFTAVNNLKEMETALKNLDVPTARLERLLAEHIDCCSYRHDAWIQGLLNFKLSMMRFIEDDGENIAQEGLYLGAYAWLENLRPDNKVFTPVRDLDKELAVIFQRDGEAPLATDSTNYGYIHAPSLNHAVTAAVLRNGYVSNSTPTQPDLLNVNLSSERVRKALETLEGIRNGQSLSALLGYRFERSLHDRDPAMFVFFYQLRKAFPLVANKLESTKDTSKEAAEAIAARNVVDGYALLKKALGTSGVPDFAFLAPLLTDPAPSAAQRSFIEESIRDLLDIHDALSDIGIAESVHQIVQGNYDRAAANMDSYSKATFPQAPDVAITPRSGSGLTHRVAIQLNGRASAADLSPVAGVNLTPRSICEPALNQWLASMLPAPSTAATMVTITKPDGTVSQEKVSQENLRLQPIDLLYMLQVEDKQALGALDELILNYLFEELGGGGLHSNAVVKINYTEPIDDGINKATFFELAPLLRSLRSLVLGSSPLRATDAAPPGEASAQNEPAQSLELNRVSDLKGILEGHKTDLTNLKAAWAVLPDVDTQITDFAEVMSKVGIFGFQEANFGFVYNWRQEQFTSLLKKVGVRMALWQGRLDEYNNLITVQLPAATDDETRFGILRKAEALVSTENTTPLPPDVPSYLIIIQNKGNAFSSKKAVLEAIAGAPPAKLNLLISAINVELPFTQFDSQAFDLANEQKLVTLFQEDLLAKVGVLEQEVQNRINSLVKTLTDHAAAADPNKKVKLLQDAGKSVFGEDFLMIPAFQLPEKQGFEWENALTAKSQVLKFQTTEKSDPDPFPVDTWLYGVSRVREKIRQLENAWMLTEAFEGTTKDLEPVQFPFRLWKPRPDTDPALEEPEPWLALEYPEAFQLKEEKILYTAVYATAFDRTQPQCGLLVDEWTEVVPAKEETTGLTFHYDRPNSEPPQSWLLVTPTTFTGNWTWQDLVDALNETLDLAKQRSVSPMAIENTALGVFSPATVFPVTPWRIHPSLNLNLVNQNLVRPPGS